jgi:hypothetical protein
VIIVFVFSKKGMVMNFKSYVGVFAFLAASLLMFTACDDTSSSPSAGIDRTNVKTCDEMIKEDVNTWHFIRKDAFGDDAEYIYKAEGRDLIVTIKGANGSDTKTYSMYNMESEVGVEMAYRAAKATCEDGQK